MIARDRLSDAVPEQYNDAESVEIADALLPTAHALIADELDGMADQLAEYAHGGFELGQRAAALLLHDRAQSYRAGAAS